MKDAKRSPYHQFHLSIVMLGTLFSAGDTEVGKKPGEHSVTINRDL